MELASGDVAAAASQNVRQWINGHVLVGSKLVERGQAYQRHTTRFPFHIAMNFRRHFHANHRYVARRAPVAIRRIPGQRDPGPERQRGGNQGLDRSSWSDFYQASL